MENNETDCDYCNGQGCPRCRETCYNCGEVGIYNHLNAHLYCEVCYWQAVEEDLEKERLE